ncbi:hypothetical protein SAMN05880501_1234 [Ureibacillus xyleni]|uniref:Uncharacterized protein n=1 Tax=Ureibacillus xyleni TaxID=614648 RepID=A0A285TU56_9BACL|nr:hypothetical protein [Ureibacillus xyleni]SOC27525.1 hypothetical protein SAMN05880501_1234 [Ureibacillus xyleni]
MKRMPFEPPTEHYDQRVAAIDEEICHLLKQRKDLSNNPGFPTRELIATWAEKYSFYKDFLNIVFANFLNEEFYKPIVEPNGFLKNIPILKSFEKDDIFYTVTFVSQFENASVVHLDIDRIYPNVDWHHREHSFFELSIEGKENYDCRIDGGGGTGGHESFTFVISPTLPDDISKYKLMFKQYKMPNKKPTGIEFVISGSA